MRAYSAISAALLVLVLVRVHPLGHEHVLSRYVHGREEEYEHALSSMSTSTITRTACATGDEMTVPLLR